MTWLEEAMTLSSNRDNLRSQALEDHDLEPLWQTIKKA
jgi:hypothetical protein